MSEPKPWPRYVRHVFAEALRITRVEFLRDDDPAVKAKQQLALGVRVHFDEGYPPMLFDEDQSEQLLFLKAGAYLVCSAEGELDVWPELNFSEHYERLSCEPPEEKP